MNSERKLRVSEEMMLEFDARAEKIFHWKLVNAAYLIGRARPNGPVLTAEEIQKIIDDVKKSDLGEFL